MAQWAEHHGHNGRKPPISELVPNQNQTSSFLPFRPGPYWQITWRFVAPTLLGALLVSSIVFELLSTPTYSAWSALEGRAHDTEFPSWSLWVRESICIAYA